MPTRGVGRVPANPQELSRSAVVEQHLQIWSLKQPSNKGTVENRQVDVEKMLFCTLHRLFFFPFATDGCFAVYWRLTTSVFTSKATLSKRIAFCEALNETVGTAAFSQA